MANATPESEKSLSDGNLENNESQDNFSKSGLECAICLQICIHPVRLRCGHIFCYLCVKGIANQSKKCAMCRQEIPHDYLDKPELVEGSDIESHTVFENAYQWFYEGRNGWWQYDDRTSMELETAFKKEEQRCEVLVAGFLYIIDFHHMVQMRRNDPSRRRRIKRDLASINKKGVAGIRLPPSEESNAETDTAVNEPCNVSESNATLQSEMTKSSTTPATPSNTPQTPSFGGDTDTSVPSSPGRNSVLVDVDRSLVQALHTLRLYEPRNNVDLNVNNSRHSTRIEPWDVNLSYSDEEEL